MAVLTPAECKLVFGVHLAGRGIQAVWVRVVNRSSSGTRLLMTKIAPDYYTAREAAGVCHFSIAKRLLAYGLLIWFFLPLLILFLPFKLLATRRANLRMNECFQSLGFPLKNIAPGATAEGIVFTPLEFGTKRPGRGPGHQHANPGLSLLGRRPRPDGRSPMHPGGVAAAGRNDPV